MELTREEKVYLKLGKILLDKFLTDLGKEVEDEKLKNNVYSFLKGVKAGTNLAGEYKEEDFFSSLGTIFGYVFASTIRGYLEKSFEQNL